MGELILDRMFGVPGPDADRLRDFGVLLSTAMIDEHLAMQRRGAERYGQEFGAEIGALLAHSQ